MKYSLRKSFSFRRGKKARDVDLRNSNSNLVKSKTRRSSSSSSSLIDRNKVKVFEPRYDIHSTDEEEDNDDDQQLVSSSNKTRPLNRFTEHIRRSFRNPLQHRSSPQSINPPLSNISIGLTSPLIIEENRIDQRGKLSTQINQSNSLEEKSNVHRSFRTRFTFFKNKSPINQTEEHSSRSTSLTQRFHSLRRSLPLGRRNSSTKGHRHLLSNE